MEDSEPSRLQGAFRNYIRTSDFDYPYITESAGKWEEYFNIFKIIAVLTSAVVAFILIFVYYDGDYFLINSALFVAVMLCVVLLLYNKFIPFRSMFKSLGRVFCCPWISCPKVSTENRGIQTGGNASFQHATLHEATDVQTLRQPVAEEPTASFVFNKYLPSRRLFHLGRIFHCPSSCCSTVYTEDLEIQSEDNAARQPAGLLHNTTTEQDTYQPVIRQNQIEETAFQPGALQELSEEGFVSAKLLTAEKQLLQYLLGDTGEEESSSNH